MLTTPPADPTDRLTVAPARSAHSRRRARAGNRSRQALLGLTVVLVVGAAVFVGAGWQSSRAQDTGAGAGAGDPSIPGPDAVDAGFLRDMIVHHEQAVSMAFLIRDRGSDNLMDAIATDIIYNQLIQIGTMRGYLDVWNLPLDSDEPAMTWMGHPVAAGGRMPGMASPEELVQLRDLPTAEGEVLFLRLMIRHHVSGVEMAQAGLALADSRPARDLAAAIIPLQRYEIELMQAELLARGQSLEPVPDFSATPAPSGSNDDHASGHSGHTMTGTPER